MTTPTTNPVPSSAAADLLFNAEKIDEAVSSAATTYVDRLGVVRQTLAGAVASIAAINPRGTWVTATAYAVKDAVLQSGTWYLCVVAHTSAASFSTDQASKWRVYQGVTTADLDASLASFTKHITQYGTIVGNGTANDAATWQAAAASSARVIDARGLNCRLDSVVNIPAGQTWLLQGTTIVLASSTQTVLAATNVDGWALIGPFKIVGDGSTVGTAKGISVAGGRGWRVNDYTAQSIRGHGFYLVPGSSGVISDHGHLSNFRAIDCYKGWEDTPGTGAEYTTLSAPYIRGCVDGMTTAAGNLLVIGGQIVDCTNDNVVLKNGSNHGHGAFVGTNINHAIRYNVFAQQVTNGQDFVGCHLYGNGSGSGAIFLDRSKGVVFTGGHLDCWVYNDKDGSSGMNYIRGMYCPGSYGDVQLNAGPNPGQDQLQFQDCYGAGAYRSGITINDPSPCYVLADRVGGGGTQALTSGVAADLVFPTERFDRRAAYNNSTGLFTVPAGMAGTYRFTFSALFGGTAMSTTASFVDLKVSGSSYKLFFPSVNSTTKLAITGSGDMQLNAGDTIRLAATITGTTPVFGDAAWASTLTVERIA